MNFTTRAISFLLAALLIPALIAIIYKEYIYFWWSAAIVTLWLVYELINKAVIKRRNK